MSTGRNRWIDAIGKLIALTQERKLAWRGYSAEDNPILSSKTVGVVYEADYNGKTLRLYEPKFRAHRQLTGSGEWESEAVLELVDSTGLSVWTFPQTDATEHLLRAVKYQVAGVRQFLEELLTA